MYGFRRVVGCRTRQGHAVHKRVVGRNDLHLDLYRSGGQHSAIGDRDGSNSSTVSDSNCEPEHGRERKQVDTDLVIDERNILRRVRGMERQSGNHWLTKHCGTHGFRGVHADLYGTRRHRGAGCCVRR